MGVVSRRRVWLAGGMYGCGYQEVGDNVKMTLFSAKIV